MITATEARSGKGHTDENFPVASRLIQAQHRGPILAFYRFVRAADDIADHPKLAPDEKLAMLDRLDAALTGRGPADPEAEPLKAALAERGLPPRHALDLLDAFRMDATKLRYADWRELMHYCSLSAMPVGRFVLDVHGESPQTTWPASDAICAALQVINHLQDCANDYRNLDRVYLPLDALSRHGARVEDLGGGEGDRRPEGDDRRSRRALARSSSHDGAPLADLVVGHAARDGDRGDPPPRRQSRDGSEASRSAVREGAPRQGRLRADRARRRRRRASAPAVREARPSSRSRRDAEALMAVAANHAPAPAGADASPALPAAGSSFYLAMRILPRARREAMYAIYAFCRAVDDIADDGGPREPRRAALARWRADIDRLYRGHGDAGDARPRRADRAASGSGARTFTPSSTAWRWTSTPTSARRTGRRSTSTATAWRAPSAGSRCASSASSRRLGDQLAHHLGRALQLTNILRDLDEDAEMGRLYLPREALQNAGIAIDGRAPAAILLEPRIDEACRKVAARAAEHFAEASHIMARCPRRTVRAPRLMEAAYRRILADLNARGFAPPRERVRINKLRLVGALLRYGIV